MRPPPISDLPKKLCGAIHCCEDCSRRFFCGRTATLQGMKVPVDQNRNNIRVLDQSLQNTRTSDLYLDMFVWKVQLLDNKMGCTYARTKGNKHSFSHTQ